MLDTDTPTEPTPEDGAAEPVAGPPADPPPAKKAAKRTTKKAAEKSAEKSAEKPAKKAAKKAPAKKAATKVAAEAPEPVESAEPVPEGEPTAPAKKTARLRAAAPRKKAAAAGAPAEPAETPETPEAEEAAGAPAVLFQAPEVTTTTRTTTRKRASKKAAAPAPVEEPVEEPAEEPSEEPADEPAESETESGSENGSGNGSGDQDDNGDEQGGNRRRRRRGGRRRRRSGEGGDDAEGHESADGAQDESDEESEAGDTEESGGSSSSSSSRRRRRRRRANDSDDSSSDDPENTVTRVRKQRSLEDEITGVSGSTRLEAKKQRRREGREAGRRRAPIVSEAEFLARRESVDRVMVIRQREELTQIGVLEDKVLVEHYVARESQTSMIGNVYLGRVQNVLPSMEAAFIDIGKGRNAVLYAGEVNWAAVGHKEGQPRKIESVLSSGQTILVQVTKDPIGHKGARLSGQVSLPGRFLVLVPEGNTSGISRKLPDTERNRLKTLLKEIVPDSAGVIVRTAAEGASEEELTKDVERLTARWNDIEEKVKGGKSPQLLYGEPDLTLKVVRDLFTEDFAKLVVQGDDAWDLVDDYVSHVAPDLRERLEKFEPAQDGPNTGKDVFAAYRVDEQIAKGLDRKVWLPSGGSLVIDRTEAMTVVDVNTGKFTGSGGNLEETVTKNNLEAAEEIVRQLRLRDIGGIIVIDFIDMVLESNRDLVLRRLVECLGRDRTRHQVAEVTSLGLVQMTRKRIGTGLLEAFGTDCEACKGRGIVVHDHPVDSGGRSEDDEPRSRRSRGGRGRSRSGGTSGNGGNGNGGGNGRQAPAAAHHPSPADLAHAKAHEPDEETEETVEQVEQAEELQHSVIGSPTPVDAEPMEVPTETAEQPAPETSAGPEAEPEAEPEPAEEPKPVTSVVTRRRATRRPAGPPAAATNPEPVSVPVEPAGQPDGDGDDAGEETDEDGSSVLHVPVKRKGARKR